MNRGLLLLLILWLLSVLITGPAGEFPLNDDWSYLEPLHSLYYQHSFYYSDWVSSTLVSQLIWALCFCKIFGYKILVARISTLASTALIIVFLHRLISKIIPDQRYVFFATAVFAFNPVMYVESFTFMTESSFNLSMILCALSAFLYIETGRKWFLLMLTLFSCIGVLVKQPAIIIPACLPLLFLISRKKRKIILHSALPFISTALIYLIFLAYVNIKFNHPQHINGVNGSIISSLKAGASLLFFPQIKDTMITIMYAGFFMIPFIPVIIKNYYSTVISIMQHFKRGADKTELDERIERRAKRFHFISLTALSASAVIFTGYYTIPCIENILYNCGLGPLLFRDTFLLYEHHDAFAVPPFIFRIISIAGLTTGLCLSVILISNFIAALRRIYKNTYGRSDLYFTLIFISSAVYMFLLVNVYMFDRYIIALIPLFIILLSMRTAENIKTPFKNHFAGMILIIPFLLFSVCATHDYLQWNDAKWKALNILTDQLKISPREIDGGYEFNGINGYDKNYKTQDGKSWWWVIDDKYILTMGPLPGYGSFFSVPYKSWLPGNRPPVHVLKRL